MKCYFHIFPENSSYNTVCFSRFTKQNEAGTGTMDFSGHPSGPINPATVLCGCDAMPERSQLLRSVLLKTE